MRADTLRHVRWSFSSALRASVCICGHGLPGYHGVVRGKADHQTGSRCRSRRVERIVAQPHKPLIPTGRRQGMILPTVKPESLNLCPSPLGGPDRHVVHCTYDNRRRSLTRPKCRPVRSGLSPPARLDFHCGLPKWARCSNRNDVPSSTPGATSRGRCPRREPFRRMETNGRSASSSA